MYKLDMYIIFKGKHEKPNYEAKHPTLLHSWPTP